MPFENIFGRIRIPRSPQILRPGRCAYSVRNDLFKTIDKNQKTEIPNLRSSFVCLFNSCRSKIILYGRLVYRAILYRYNMRMCNMTKSYQQPSLFVFVQKKKIDVQCHQSRRQSVFVMKHRFKVSTTFNGRGRFSVISGKSLKSSDDHGVKKKKDNTNKKQQKLFHYENNIDVIITLTKC